MSEYELYRRVILGQVIDETRSLKVVLMSGAMAHLTRFIMTTSLGSFDVLAGQTPQALAGDIIFIEYTIRNDGDITGTLIINIYYDTTAEFSWPHPDIAPGGTAVNAAGARLQHTMPLFDFPLVIEVGHIT